MEARPRVIQVIEADERRGGGTSGDPIRLVRRYYTLDGQLLAENDPLDETASHGENKDG